MHKKSDALIRQLPLINNRTLLGQHTFLSDPTRDGNVCLCACGTQVLVCMNENKTKYWANRWQKGIPCKDTKTISTRNAAFRTLSQWTPSLLVSFPTVMEALWSFRFSVYESTDSPLPLPQAYKLRMENSFDFRHLDFCPPRAHLLFSHGLGCLLSQPSVKKGIVPAEVAWCHYF